MSSRLHGLCTRVWPSGARKLRRKLLLRTFLPPRGLFLRVPASTPGRLPADVSPRVALRCRNIAFREVKASEVRGGNTMKQALVL
jgi:hypothetical protein